MSTLCFPWLILCLPVCLSLSAGDWVPPPPYGQTNMQLISAFSFMRDLDTLVNMAQLLNYTADYSSYSAWYASLAAEWHTTWYHDGIKGYADGMQAANVMSLFLPRVVPDALRADVLNSLVKDVQTRGQFTTGMISFARLFPVLSESGHHDLALELVQQTSYPSLGFEFNNPYEENATSLWEVWNAPQQGVIMDSRNHAMFGSISAWFYRYVAGISINAFQPILIRPRMATNHSLLQQVHAEVQSIAGAITVDYFRSFSRARQPHRQCAGQHRGAAHHGGAAAGRPMRSAVRGRQDRPAEECEWAHDASGSGGSERGARAGGLRPAPRGHAARQRDLPLRGHLGCAAANRCSELRPTETKEQQRMTERMKL